MEKVYHIYAKEECLYNNLNEEQFNSTWETLKGMVGLMKTDYELEDLSYEEVVCAHGGVGALSLIHISEPTRPY